MITTIENGVPTTTWVEAGSLGNTVTASNGLTKEGNDIKLEVSLLLQLQY